MNLRIRGKRWRLVWAGLNDEVDLGDGEGLEKSRGACEGAWVPGKRIIIRRTLPLRLELDTFLHEALHAGFWDLAEESVEEMATDLARALLRCYRIRKGRRS